MCIQNVFFFAFLCKNIVETFLEPTTNAKRFCLGGKSNPILLSEMQTFNYYSWWAGISVATLKVLNSKPVESIMKNYSFKSLITWLIRFVSWIHFRGHVIQGNERLIFEDELRSGGLQGFTGLVILGMDVSIHGRRTLLDFFISETIRDIKKMF